MGCGLGSQWQSARPLRRERREMEERGDGKGERERERERKRERERDKEREIERKRAREREIEKERDRERHRETCNDIAIFSFMLAHLVRSFLCGTMRPSQRLFPVFQP